MDETWQSLVTESKGSYAIFCKSLETKRIVSHRPNEKVESMSTIKLPILLCVLDNVQNKKLSLKQRVHVERADVGRNGSGILQHFYLNTPIELYNLVEMMMSISDNAATNRLIRLLGKDQINDYIRSLGLKATKLHMTKLDFPSNYIVGKDEQLGVTTAKEMAQLLELLLKGELLQPTYTNMTKKILRQVKTSFFMSKIPYEYVKEYGSKTGGAAFALTKPTVINECGFILDRKGKTYIFSQFSTLPMDKKLPYSPYSISKIEFANISSKVYQELFNQG